MDESVYRVNSSRCSRRYVAAPITVAAAFSSAVSTTVFLLLIFLLSPLPRTIEGRQILADRQDTCDIAGKAFRFPASTLGVWLRCVSRPVKHVVLTGFCLTFSHR